MNLSHIDHVSSHQRFNDVSSIAMSMSNSLVIYSDVYSKNVEDCPIRANEAVDAFDVRVLGSTPLMLSMLDASRNDVYD